MPPLNLISRCQQAYPNRFSLILIICYQALIDNHPDIITSAKPLWQKFKRRGYSEVSPKLAFALSLGPM